MSINDYSFKYICLACYLKIRFYCLTCSAMSNLTVNLTLTWNLNLSDTDLDLLDKDIPSQHFVCLQDFLKRFSRRLQRNNFLSSKTSSRRLGRRKIVTRCLGRRKIVTLKTFWRRLQDMSRRRLQDVFKTNKCLLGGNCKKWKWHYG